MLVAVEILNYLQPIPFPHRLLPSNLNSDLTGFNLYLDLTQVVKDPHAKNH